MRPAAILLASMISMTAACGGGGEARSAEEIAAGLRTAIEDTHGAPALEPAAENRANEVVCDVLEGAGSEFGGSLADQLRAQAAQAQLRQDLGLEEYDPGLPERLAAAADAIDSANLAADVADRLSC